MKFNLIKKHLQPQEKTKSPLWTKILIAVVTLGLIGVLTLLIAVAQVSSELPNLKDGTFINSESTVIYDREGNTLYTVHGEENRKEISLADIPKVAVNATIAIEDDQFFNHSGIDLIGTTKATICEVFSKITFSGIRCRGASTLTQQLVKNTLLSPERTITRKIKEILLAIQVERTFSKNEILEMYFNTIPYGSNAYGIEMAAKIFFDKNAKDLSLLESSILASLPKAPSYYSPYGGNKDILMGYFNESGDFVPGRKDTVLKRMEDLNYISNSQRIEATQEARDFRFEKFQEDIKHPHFVLYIKEILENKFGKEAVEKGGLHVYTTIDPNLQQKAEEIITEKIASYPDRYGVNNTALFSIDVKTGQILAMVGSADYWDEEIDGAVNMTLRKRLAGSSFKPIVYATGFAQGYSPATVFYDLETDFGNNYIPQNYDGEFRGPVSARRALGNSLNVPAVKMAYVAGIDNILNLAKKMGITVLKGADQYGLSLGLGTGEISLYQMVKAFSVFARGGNTIEVTPFLRIESKDGAVIESFQESREELVLDPEVAYTINHILSDPSARPEEWNFTLQIPNQITAVKTGTSNKKVKVGNKDVIKPLDNWTIGYTKNIATGVWAGNNDSTPLKFEAAGLTTAGKIWKEFMIEATKKHDLEEFNKPEGIQWKSVSKYSGKLPSKATPKDQIYSELFTSFNIPLEIDNTYIEIEIDRVSKKLPTEFTPIEAITQAAVENFQTLNPGNPDWEEPLRKWVKEEFLKENTQVLSEIPSEEDNVHTAETKLKAPTIHIISPQDGSILGIKPIEIKVSIEAPHKVKKVEFEVNGKVMDTATKAPWTGKIRPLPKSNKPYRIRAKIYDKLYYTSSDTSKITIVVETKDTNPPTTRIVFPKSNSSLSAETEVLIQTDTSDDIRLQTLTFFFNDMEIYTTDSPPYTFNYTIPDKKGSHILKVRAKDERGNIAEDSINITIKE
jgi:membrane peptidoglycan carboxypeptidase